MAPSDKRRRVDGPATTARVTGARLPLQPRPSGEVQELGSNVDGGDDEDDVDFSNSEDEFEFEKEDELDLAMRAHEEEDVATREDRERRSRGSRPQNETLTSSPSQVQVVYHVGQLCLHASIGECEVVEAARNDGRVRVVWEKSKGSGANTTVQQTFR